MEDRDLGAFGGNKVALSFLLWKAGRDRGGLTLVTGMDGDQICSSSRGSR